MPKDSKSSARKAAAVSLRGAGDRDGPRVLTTFRCPRDLKQYISDAAAAPHRDKTEVITSALELDRDLAKELRAEESRLAEFAAAHDLKMSKDLAEVLALLVKLGLASWERDKKVKPR